MTWRERESDVAVEGEVGVERWVGPWMTWTVVSTNSGYNRKGKEELIGKMPLEFQDEEERERGRLRSEYL